MNKQEITIYPWIAGSFIAVAAIFLFYWDFRWLYYSKRYLYNIDPQLIFDGMLVSHLAVAYFAYHVLCYSPIKIIGDKLIMPTTNYRGVPSLLCWGRITIDIPSIRKINQFEADADTTYRLRTLSRFGVSYEPLQDDKIAIIYNNSTVELNIGFYGRDNLNYLVDNLWQLNENIDIADRGI